MVNDILKSVQRVVSENSAAILTGLGVTGTVSTAVLTAKATVKTIRDYDSREQILEDFEGTDMTTWEKVAAYGPNYIPAVGVGAVTIGCIIAANRVSSKQAAAFAAAYGLKDKAFEDYKEKVQEKLGVKKETEVRDEIAAERVASNPGREIVIITGADVLCYDMLSDRYFQSTIEKIKQAENTLNYEIANHDEVSLSRFYDEIGLKPTPFSDTIGWNIDRRPSLQFSTVMSPDDRPCIAIDFGMWPEPSYHKRYE